VSPACSIRLVMPEGPGDLSGCNFLISCLSSSGVNGVMNKGCVVVVAGEACSLIVGGGGFRRPWDPSTHEILPLLWARIYEAERTLDLLRAARACP